MIIAQFREMSNPGVGQLLRSCPVWYNTTIMTVPASPRESPARLRPFAPGRLFFFAAVLLLFLACTGLHLPVGPGETIPPTLPAPSDLHLTPADVTFYPLSVSDSSLLYYRGDVLSLDITPRRISAIRPEDVGVRVYRVDSPERDAIAEGTVGYPAFDGVPRARLTWVWDTRAAGESETLVIHLDPDDRIQVGDEDPTNNVVTLTVRFLPATARPTAEAAATWAVTTTNCCIVHYLTHTAAERDLPTIVATVNEAVAGAERRLGTHLVSPLQVYLIGRVLGHGGYAREGVVISYLDRHYAGADLEMVLRHEAAHVLDASLAGPATPSLLREGLATWVAGGHYKPENIPRRAGALVSLGRYIPLAQLAENFYHHQHETGYLEAAAFVAYLVETYGWEEFRAFYRESGQPDAGASPAVALDGALRQRFGMGLAEADRAFRAWLVARNPPDEEVRDLDLTIRLFDAVRRYQQLYDPPAYFLSGWLPDPVEATERGIVADFLRRPREPRAVAIEAMLAAAQDALERGALDRAADLLAGAERALEGDFSASPAADYLAIVRAVAAEGAEVQRVELNGTTARVWVTTDSPFLQVWTLQRTDAQRIGGE